MVYGKKWGLIKVIKKPKKSKIAPSADLFWGLGAFRGGYKEGVDPY